MRLISRLIIFIFLGIFCAGCATAINPVTHRQEFILINTASEVSIGNNMAKEIQAKYKLSNDAEKINRVQTVGMRVASASDRQDLQYHFNVIEDKEINAFAAPGGYIYVNTGLLDAVSSDDELAGVLAHEVGHVAALHSVKKIQAVLGYNILASIALRSEKYNNIRKGVDTSVSLVMLGYSRQDELQADVLGVRYMRKAGYDPNGIVTFLEKMEEKEKKDPTSRLVFLRSHPYAGDRVKAVRAEIATSQAQGQNVTLQ